MMDVDDEKDESESEGDDYDTRTAVMKQNRKNKKSGGFQSMGKANFDLMRLI